MAQRVPYNEGHNEWLFNVRCGMHAWLRAVATLSADLFKGPPGLIKLAKRSMLDLGCENVVLRRDGQEVLRIRMLFPCIGAISFGGEGPV